MKRNFEQEILELFENLMKGVELQQALFTINYSAAGSSSTEGYVVRGEERTSDILPKEVRKLVKSYFDSVKENPENRFNKVEFEINQNGTSQVRYRWDDEHFKKDQMDTARVFPQWINDRMISLIYSYEFPNGPTAKDEDGDSVYISTWDRGIFTFKVTDKRIESEITLYKGEVARTAHLKLPDYFIDALLEHHEITTNGILKHEWKPWNKLVINSPHNDLPFSKMDEHVFYSYN